MVDIVKGGGVESINRLAEFEKEVIRMDDSLTRRGDGRHQSGRDEVTVS